MPRGTYPSELADSFNVRMPDGLRDQIKAAAKAAGRSMNAEIVHRLSTWREPPTGGTAIARLEVDTSQADQALHLVNQLRAAAEQANEACQKLGIKIGSV